MRVFWLYIQYLLVQSFSECQVWYFQLELKRVREYVTLDMSELSTYLKLKRN